ncbi:MAG TPA: septation protein A [Beijerinckiaceae bacterium]|nr:septation protein A [Beijerinckiaceae bacterium]
MNELKAVQESGKPAGGTPRVGQGLKFVLELGPLGLFFVANWKFGIFAATAVLMASVILALLASWMITRRLPIMPVVTAVAVIVFGSLTFIFKDEAFIKMKPTIVNLLFGGALLGALGFGKPLLPIVLDSVLNLTEEGWRKLTLRWGLFFLFLAALNEVVWRTQSTDFWVSFKVFATIPITLLFALAQTPLILRHEIKGEANKEKPDHF